MMKLTDSQLVILSAAARRPDGSILPLSKSVKLNKGAATLVLKSLLRHRLVAEQRADAADESWRESGDGERFALSITADGLKAIGVEELSDGEAAPAPANTGLAGRRASRTTTAAAPKKRPKEAARKGTKLSVLIELLSRKTGTTVEEAAKATGWQNHSVRGAISGALKKKMGLEITSGVSGSRGRVYRIGTTS